MPILILRTSDTGIIPVSGALNWEIIGSDNVDTFQIDSKSTATVSGGGGQDIIQMADNADKYNVVQSGSSAVFTHKETGAKTSIPVNSSGDFVKLGTGESLLLKFDTGAIKLGTQTVNNTVQNVTGRLQKLSATRLLD